MVESFDYTLPRKNKILNSFFSVDPEGKGLVLFDTSILSYPDVKRKDLTESMSRLTKSERYCHVLSRQLYNTEFNDLDKETKNKLRSSIIKYRINYSTSIAEFSGNRDVLLIDKVRKEASGLYNLANMFNDLEMEGKISSAPDLGCYTDLKDEGLYHTIFYYILGNRGGWISNKEKLIKKSLNNNTDEHVVTTSIYASHMLERPVVVLANDSDITDELNGFFSYSRGFNTEFPKDLREVAQATDISLWGWGKESLSSLHNYFKTKPKVVRELVHV